MPRGFFERSLVTRKAPISMLPKCGACGLHKTCGSPKMDVSGEGRRKILIVGEAPGEQEDRKGKQFVGKTGTLLSETLSSLDCNMRRDCWLTNALICRPPENATPSLKQIDYCRANLINTVKTLKPETIILLGSAAVSSLIGWLWKDGIKKITPWVGWRIPSQQLDAWLCPTWHPSHIARSEEKDPLVKVFFRRHLKAALAHERRPWEGAQPDYKKLIDLIYDDDEAAERIREITRHYDGLVAIDYEANMLKPDARDRVLVSCALGWEGRAISYLWRGAAIKATREFIRSKIPKVASNLKMEERWTRAEFKHGVRNWYWDTMNSAHVIDWRKGITGLKFQAFVVLGCESYDDHIKKFLQAKKGKRINQILEEIAVRDLLFYGGMDAVLEEQLAIKQMKLVDYPVPNYRR